MARVIVEIESRIGTIKVVKLPDLGEGFNLYDVYKNDEIKHPACTAEDVMRALGFYLQGAL